MTMSRKVAMIWYGITGVCHFKVTNHVKAIVVVYKRRIMDFLLARKLTPDALKILVRRESRSVQ